MKFDIKLLNQISDNFFLSNFFFTFFEWNFKFLYFYKTAMFMAADIGNVHTVQNLLLRNDIDVNAKSILNDWKFNIISIYVFFNAVLYQLILREF